MKAEKHDITNTTKDRLIEAGIHLFARYGYNGTTTRMISDAVGINMNAIQFHFGGKEGLYKSVLAQVAQVCETSYIDINKEIHAKKKEGKLDADEVRRLIANLIDIQLSNAINEESTDILALMYWEQLEPHGGDYMPISRMMLEKSEETLALLFCVVDPSIPPDAAAIISRFINGGIISFGEHAAFLDNIKSKSISNDYNEHIRKTLKPFIMNIIDCLLCGNTGA